MPLKPEPVLRADDIAAWDVWMRTAAVHARTRAFVRHVDAAKRAVEQARCEASEAGLPESIGIAVSAGKDSTAMWHLVAVEMGVPCVAVSEKDDLDYPGEEDYLRALSAAWSAPLCIVRPDVSPSALIADLAARGELLAGDDIHGRSATLSKVCFYDLIEAAMAPFSIAMLGIRAEESGIRKRMLASKGRVYELRGRSPRQWRCNPIGRWTGLDVYAYALSRGFDLLHVYRCVGMNQDEPWRVRKSWWLPGAATARGQVVWLRRYYPSLYAQMCQWMPSASLHG